MLNPVQRQFVFDKIPNTGYRFNGADLTIPKYRQESELPDIPDIPFMAIGFTTEGVDLGFNTTAGPQKIYYDRVAGCYAWEYGKWFKATVSISMVDILASRLETCASQLFLWLLSRQWTFGYHPSDTTGPNLKFGELLAAKPLAFSYLNHKVRPERETYVSMLDFSIWYLASWVMIGPPMVSFDQQIEVPDKINFISWLRGMQVDFASLNICGYMPGSYGIDMRLI